jgi:hypothetical protein
MHANRLISLEKDPMIDLLTVVYCNYALLEMQVSHWRCMQGEKRLLVCDTTPSALRQSVTYPDVEVYELEATGIDGEIHGAALDLLVRKARTALVGVFDTDFFWLRTDILNEATQLYNAGIQCLGCAGFYPDWQARLDPRHPERAGHLAPVCWGMFVDRALALSETFVVTAEEATTIRETGWRLRDRIIRERISCLVYPGFSHPADPELCYFGEPERPIGIHLLKGSSTRAGLTDQLSALIEEGKAKWS